MSDDYERLLTVKPEVLVYRLPPRASNRGHRAADWGLDKPSWKGRMKIVALGNAITIKLIDQNGELFAQAPIDAYPGVAVESVLDSSRYFVLKIADVSGRTAFIGIGFADRGDAFDFNVTLQDHFNSLKKDKEIAKSLTNETPLNLGLKEGQTFKINLGGKLGAKGQSTARPRTNAPAVAQGGLLLPPPPGSALKTQVVQSHPATGSAKPQVVQSQQAVGAVSYDLLGLGVNPSNPPAPSNPFGQSDWGEFASAQSSDNASSDPNWVQF